MYGISLTTLLLIVFLTLLSASVQQASTDAETMAINASATHLAVYAGAVGRYAQANPGASGSISDASLGLPAWFHRTATEGNVVNGGSGYAYAVPSDRKTGMSIARATGSPHAGINDSGHITAPGAGDIGIAVPAGVPSGAVVVAAP